MLERRRCVSHTALRLEFSLDDATWAALREELADVLGAAEDDGRILTVRNGAAAHAPSPNGGPAAARQLAPITVPLCDLADGPQLQALGPEPRAALTARLHAIWEILRTLAAARKAVERDGRPLSVRVATATHAHVATHFAFEPVSADALHVVSARSTRTPAPVTRPRRGRRTGERALLQAEPSARGEHWCDPELHRLRAELLLAAGDRRGARRSAQTAVALAKRSAAAGWQRRGTATLAREQRGRRRLTSRPHDLVQTYASARPLG